MNRFVFLLILWLATSSICWAQRVLYSSQAINQSYQGPAIKAIRPHWDLSPAISVKYADGRTQRILKDSIWGYEGRRGRLYRYYKGSFYRVLNTEGLVQYRIQRPTGRGVANYRYFSHTYDSPLRWTKAKARRDLNQIN